MWIDGKLTDAESGKTYTVVNPATEEVIARVPLGDKADADKAVAAARRALPPWLKKSQAERSQIMIQIATALREHAEELVNLEVLDHGTPVSLARGMGQGVHSFEWGAQVSSTMTGDVIPADAKSLLYIRREPVGVSALITPWNFPLLMVITKLATSLAAGNTCIVKPPSINSLSALKVAEILDKQDIPPGVVNFVTGPGNTVGEALVANPDVGLVAFTGSCETGKRIMEIASQTVKRLQLELGGKNPVIVLEDADVDGAVARGSGSQYFNTGQVCASPGRFYVHEKLYDEFVEKFVAASKKVVVGDPADPKTSMGPVVSAEHRDRVENFIKSGVEEGARLVLGGKRPTEPPLNKGYFIMPTVFTHVKQNMTIAREEIFGPVACIMDPFSSEDEVIDLANDNRFGLCANVWTRDRAKAIRFANELQAGVVFVNSAAGMGAEFPWGGFKESGIGKEGSRYGLEEYSQLKVVALDITG
jgi:acyl-CoA reductase-like NAD-dependent aldehyde dehydrogenase